MILVVLIVVLLGDENIVITRLWLQSAKMLWIVIVVFLYIKRGVVEM